MNPFLDLFRFTPNEKRYYRRSALPMLASIVATFASAALVRQLGAAAPFGLLAAVALLPALPIGWFFKLYIDYFRACDEWEKLIEVYGICIGLLIVGMAYFALGLLGLMALLELDGNLLAIGLLPAISLSCVFGKMVGRWRHG